MRTKKPTLSQKKIIASAGLCWENWNVVCEDDVTLDLVSKKTGRKRSIKKRKRTLGTAIPKGPKQI